MWAGATPGCTWCLIREQVSPQAQSGLRAGGTGPDLGEKPQEGPRGPALWVPEWPRCLSIGRKSYERQLAQMRKGRGLRGV